jgi:ribosomal protein L32
MFDDMFDDNYRDNYVEGFYGNDLLEAKARAKEAVTEVRYLKYKYEKLILVTEALWEIVKEHTKCTDEELKEKIKQIDMKDGKLDGKVAEPPPKKCKKCGQTMQNNRTVCIYCGTENKNDDVFKR